MGRVAGPKGESVKPQKDCDLLKGSTVTVGAARTALAGVKDHYGRTWKYALTVAWQTGKYARSLEQGTLQRLRNELGPAWLYRQRLV